MKKAFFITFSTAFSLVFVASFEIRVENGGYTGLVVALHRNIHENSKLVVNLKSMFIKGSQFLHKVTGGRLYFKTVTIAIPEEWKGDYNQTSVFTDYYSKSHVRIAEANSEFGDAPYTLQPGECGEQGEYIHFTPKFVTEMEGWTDEVYGDVGRQLVHEFSHFRFGVFDEYGTVGNRRFPLFYQDNGRIFPTSCIKDIKGWIEQENGDPCVIYDGGNVGDECHFIPDMAPDGQTLEASLMYMPFLPTMGGFCQDGDVPANKKHNWRAPTKQNAFCQYKSAWEIIRKHPDIIESPVKKNVDTEPTFNVVHFAGNKARRTVLVMDTSISMTSEGIDRIGKLQRAASRFVKDTIPWNVSLAMVEFGPSASIKAHMTKIVNATVRDNLVAKVPEKATGGGTSIGAGLQKAIDVLTVDGGKTEGATIILISDGEENVPPRIEKVRTDLLRSRVIINTIAIGGNAAKELEGLASATGGRSFYFPDSREEAAGLDTAFQSSISAQTDVEFQPLTISQSIVKVTADKQIVKQLVIDKELGTNTVFTFTGSKLANVEVSLKSPTGAMYFEKSKEFDANLNVMRRKKFTFEQAESGTWVVFYKANVSSDVVVSLTSEVRDPNDQPIRASSWFDKVELKYPAYVKVLARVTKGHSVVLNATVKATIVRPNGNGVEIPLRDNGAGADGIKDDGIYSSFFKGFTGNGRYAAVATIVNDGKARIKLSGTNFGQVSRAPPKPKDQKTSGTSQTNFPMEMFRQAEGPIPEPQFTSEPADDFSRLTDLGNFKLTNYVIDNRDLTPPNRVSDLRVESISEPILSVDSQNILRTVTLVWTAAGDDLDEGNVTSVDVRGSKYGETLFTHFDDEFQLSSNDTEMLEAGNLQRMTFDLPMEWNLTEHKEIDLYFALRSVDKAGNKAEVSNIASGHIGYSAPAWNKENGKSNTGMVVGVIIGVLIGIGLIVGIVFYWKKK